MLKSSLIYTLAGILFFISSCGKNGEKKVNPHQGDLSNNRHGQIYRGDRCHLQQIIDVSEDGEYVLGLSLKSDEKRIEIIHVSDRRQVALVHYFNYVQASVASQNFVVKNVENQYLLMHQEQGEMIEKWRFPIDPQDYPDFEFSRDGKLLLVRYRYSLFTTRSKIQVYDVDSGSRIFQSQVNNVKFARLGWDSKFLFLGTEDYARSKRRIMKLDLDSGRTLFDVDLRQTNSLFYLGVTSNRIITKFHDTFYFHSIEDGSLESSKKLFYLWSLNEDGIAVGSEGYDDVMIFDTNSEEILEQMPKGLIVPSSCRIDNQKNVLCKTDERPDFISKVHFDRETIHNECL